MSRPVLRLQLTYGADSSANSAEPMHARSQASVAHSTGEVYGGRKSELRYYLATCTLLRAAGPNCPMSSCLRWLPLEVGLGQGVCVAAAEEVVRPTHTSDGGNGMTAW